MIDLKYAHGKLRMVFRNVPETIHAGLMAFFLFHTLVMRDKTRLDKSSSILTLIVIGDREINIMGSRR